MVVEPDLNRKRCAGCKRNRPQLLQRRTKHETVGLAPIRYARARAFVTSRRVPVPGTRVCSSVMAEELGLSADSISWPQKHRARGEGSFGAVYAVKFNGFPCIAKRLHDVLSQVTDQDQKGPSIHERFMRECKLLSTLRHPNIVQFIGIHKGRGERDVSLIMEGLYTDLEKFLATNPEVPLFLKLSFLLDTSDALVYLHMHFPPIIHRDVKAANVLLSHDMHAKLADLGVSKLLDFHPLSNTIQTHCPGTLGIMPPEALQMEPIYDAQLDVFSFGTLILHTVNQDFPMPCEVSAAKKKGEMQIAKRQEAIDKLKKHCLYELVKQCLQDHPSKRPSMEKARDTIEKMHIKHPCSFTTFYDMYQEIEGLKKVHVYAILQYYASHVQCTL